MHEGRPFVGASGQLLAKALKEVGIDLDRCFITNSVNVYFPHNPTPSDEEIASQSARVMMELKQAQCRRVLVLGNCALYSLTRKKFITRERGRWFRVAGMDCIAALHPAAILRNARAFPTFAEDLKAFARGPVDPVPKPQPIVVHSAGQWRALRGHLKPGPLAFDIETTGLDSRTHHLTAAAISDGTETVVFPKERLRLLSEFFRRTNPPVVGHNVIAFDAPFWTAHGFHMPPVLADTMLLRYAAGTGGPYDLKSLAATLCGAPAYAVDPTQALPEFLYEYVGFDAYYTWHLFDRLKPTMETRGYRWIHDHALAIAVVQQRGCLIDVDYLETQERELQQTILAQREQTPMVNPLSPQQVKGALAEEQIYVESTSSETLQAVDSPTAKQVLAVRKDFKLLSTVKQLKQKALASPERRIRTSFLLHGTVTGRLSSKEPNLQNIPRGPSIRQAFIAPPGRLLVEADYSQLEFRVAAYLSKDPRLTDHFINGDDIHRMVASSAFGRPVEEITKEERTIAKGIGFGILYGAGIDKVKELILEATTHTWEEAIVLAEQVMTRLKQDYRRLFDWTRKTADTAVKEQEVRTPTGRVRLFPLITSENIGEVRREAVNTPIQSLASDICLHAVAQLVAHPWHGKLFDVILTVHDSIIVEADRDHARNVAFLVATTMRNSPNDILGHCRIPWDVEWKITSAWGKEESA